MCYHLFSWEMGGRSGFKPWRVYGTSQVPSPVPTYLQGHGRRRVQNVLLKCWGEDGGTNSGGLSTQLGRCK